jgi:peptidoglycan-N-acetylglucosamine deacetylase
VKKAQVLTRFMLLAIVWVMLGAAAGAVIGTALVGWAGWLLFGLAVAAITLLAWGAFTPNSPLFGRVIDGHGAPDRVLALTFDDGPSAETTPQVLAVLRERNVLATFFVLGRHAKEHPELVAEIRADGHQVASHGYDHALLTFATMDQVTGQLELAEAAIAEASGADPTPFFRAPHGFRNLFVHRAAEGRGYRIVGWTKGVWDTAKPGVETIVRRSVSGFRPGAILLLHDGDGSGNGDDRTQTAEAVPLIVDAAHDAGYRLVTVSELAEIAPVRRVSRLRLVILVAIVAALVELGLRKLDLSAVDRIDIAWWYVLFALIANIASVLAKATVWKAALDTVPHTERTRYRDVIPALFIGFLLNTVLLARLGEIARIAVLRRRLQHRGIDLEASVAAGTVLSEQLMMGVALVVVLVATAFVTSAPHWAFRGLIGLVAVLVILALALAGMALLSRYRRRTRPAEADFARAWWAAALAALASVAHGLSAGLRLFRYPKPAAIALLAALASWLTQIAGIFWTLDAFGIRKGVSAAALVFLVSTLIQLFPIVPGNIGSFQFAVAYPLAQTYNVDLGRAIAFSIGLQIIEAALATGIGFVFLSREGLSFAEARRLPARE